MDNDSQLNPLPEYQTDGTAEQRRQDFEEHDGVTEVKVIKGEFDEMKVENFFRQLWNMITGKG